MKKKLAEIYMRTSEDGVFFLRTTHELSVDFSRRPHTSEGKTWKFGPVLGSNMEHDVFPHCGGEIAIMRKCFDGQATAI